VIYMILYVVRSTAMGKFDAAPTLAAGLIRLARAKAGMTQVQLGERAGVDQQVISAYETGRREPTMPTLTRLLAAAGFEMRIQLAPVDDHDFSILEYLNTLPPDMRAQIEESARTRVEHARLRRVRGA
jgi:transcriptional regulator with XRE-family HTH domain